MPEFYDLGPEIFMSGALMFDRYVCRHMHKFASTRMCVRLNNTVFVSEIKGHYLRAGGGLQCQV